MACVAASASEVTSKVRHSVPRRGGNVVGDVLVVAARLDSDLVGDARGTELPVVALGRDDLDR